MRSQTKHSSRIGAAVLALALVATACGGGSSPTATASSPDPDPVSQDGLAFLGDLTGDREPAVEQAIDESGGTLAIGEGVSVRAEAGAFAESTVVTAQIVELDLLPDADDPPWGRAYVVSTVEDVDLAQPVVIEIPRPAADLRAVQIIDGEITSVPIGGTDTATIEIPHFSEVVTMVLEAFDEQRAAPPEVDHGAADASFFTACFAAVNNILGGSMAPDPMGSRADLDIEYGDQMAFSICTNALIRRASPSGSHVSTACVGDRISGGIDFREAVAACDADENGTLLSDADDSDDSDEDEDQAESEEDAAVPPTPLIDGVYVGENGYIWVYSDFEVINDLVQVEVRDGAVVDFVFDRDWFKYIPLSSASPDHFDGAQCDYDANVRWVNAGPATRETFVDDETGQVSVAYRQAGQLDHMIDFPTCPREYVPVTRQADGTDNVPPIVGSALIRQVGPNVLVTMHTEEGPWGYVFDLQPG